MNWIDLLVVLVMLLAIFAGWSKGFIIGVIDLCCWVGTLVLAYLFYPYTAIFLEKFFRLGVWHLPVAFLLTAIIARLLIGLVIRYIIRAIPQRANEDSLNKFLGIIPGAINGWIYAVILSAFLFALPLKDGITEATRNSRLACTLAMQGEWANRKLAPVFDEAIRQTMNSLTIRPGSEKSVDLSFKYSHAEPRPDLEARMLEMVNREREKAGVKPLKADPDLVPVARAHSGDMFKRGYFAHKNPDGLSPFDRMDSAHIKYSYAGENLALAQTLEMAHTNLMNSPGHRANILNPSFGRLGIGILDGGFYGLMISQEFRD